MPPKEILKFLGQAILVGMVIGAATALVGRMAGLSGGHLGGFSSAVTAAILLLWWRRKTKANP